IVHNGAGVIIGASVADSTTISDAIVFNRIFANAGLGIDLGNDGVTANTTNSPHVGPNNLTSFPVLTFAGASGSATLLQVTLNAAPNTSYTIQIFANTAADPSGNGEGEGLMATVGNVFTDGFGNATLTTGIDSNLLGKILTATATDTADNTSEFAPDLL